MAVDSQSKRLSVLDLGIPWRRSLPIPDGTLSQGDRQHILGLYSGILAAEVEVVSAAQYISLEGTKNASISINGTSSASITLEGTKNASISINGTSSASITLEGTGTAHHILDN